MAKMSVKQSHSLIIFFTLLLCCNGSIRIRRMDKHGRLGVPPLPPTNRQMPPDHWFNQLLDHFEPTNQTTWKQRYQVVDDYYKDGGPVFLMIGGEGRMGGHWMLEGAWVNYAKEYNALMFQVEHRYYGESQPTSDMSVENLKYLSSEQALADLAYFIVAMNSKYKLPTDTKWVAFGGSYPGNLAAWVRLKYPHLVHAAMSASGPVSAQVDFPEYMDVVQRSLATHSQECVDAVKAANNQVNMLLKTPDGQKIIFEKFRLCSPIDTNNQEDVANLLDLLAGNFAETVQYNKDNRISPTSSITIDTLCDIMVNDSIGPPVFRYAAVNELLLEKQNIKCSDHSYENFIKSMKNTTWDADENGRQWTYQTCSEFGFYQSSESKSALFGEDFPVGFYLQQCKDIYGEKFTKEFINQAVYRTNTLYGGLELQASRVVYVHGSIDPWHALGITKTRIPQSPAIFIEGTAHCANMYPPADTDLPALTAAREEISSLIGKWIQEPKSAYFVSLLK